MSDLSDASDGSLVIGSSPPRSRRVISLLREYWEFLKTEKKRWMVVLVVLLLLVGALVTFTSSAVAPFIYAMF
jgi:hypothetical protein